VKDENLINREQSFSFGHYYRLNDLQYFRTMAGIKIPSVIKASCWIIGLGLVLGIAALWLPWVQTTSGLGQVTTLDPRDRVQDISATVSGRVAEWFVQDADFVSAGDPIVRIEDVDGQLIPRLEAQLQAAQRKYNAAQEAVSTAQIDYRRQQELFEEGLSSRLSFEQARIKVQQLTVDVESATAELNQAETALSRQGSQLIRAPRDGTILHVEAGDSATMVTAGQQLARFMPANTERAVQLFIDGRDIGLVQQGRDVRLQFEGWPAFQFSGRPDISVGTFKGEVVFVEPSAGLNGRFRVLVKQPEITEECMRADLVNGLPRMGECGWPPESFVRLGANVRGWVLLETVSLGFEIWRLLNNFPPVSNTTSTTSQSTFQSTTQGQ
jgi:RND family efflux transporter MFP subunit